jgi:hypothetical protein
MGFRVAELDGQNQPAGAARSTGVSIRDASRNKPPGRRKLPPDADAARLRFVFTRERKLWPTAGRGATFFGNQTAMFGRPFTGQPAPAGLTARENFQKFCSTIPAGRFK